MMHREPLDDMYMEHNEVLFGVINDVAFVTDEEIALVWGEQVSSIIAVQTDENDEVQVVLDKLEFNKSVLYFNCMIDF